MNEDQARRILEVMFLELRRENRADHKDIRDEIQKVSEQLTCMRLWRARVMGAAATVSALVSVGGWLIARVLGG